MRKKFASVVFDRKKELETKGIGKVEIYVFLGQNHKRYIVLKTCTPSEWKRYSKSKELAMELRVYSDVAELMYKNGEPMTTDVFDAHLGIGKYSKEKEKREKIASSTGFVDFMEEMIKKENTRESTKKQKMITVNALRQYEKLSSFASLTPRNIVLFDDWLHEVPEVVPTEKGKKKKKEAGDSWETRREPRTQVTIAKYHKCLKIYTRKAYERGYIETFPYDDEMCHFKQGRSKDRQPLTEEELVRLRELKGIALYLEHARDLFVFCAYTGLAYADCMAFDFKSMTDKHDDLYYIDGSRVKTGSTFYTPILPPAMEILKKYQYHLPQLSNQKLNTYLHMLEAILELNKPMTSHIARHSFATLCLSYDIPMDKVSRMLGHKHLRTTAIYGKILKKTINRHAAVLAGSIK